MYKIAIINNKYNYVNDFDLNRSYSLEEAISIVKELRSKNLTAELYPKEYATPNIDFEMAKEIASQEHNKIKLEMPNNYGELTIGTETLTYFCFYCRDFELENSGHTPARRFFNVNKLTGKFVTKEENREYSKLNYSF